MTAPKQVFVDTSSWESKAYDFQNQVFKAFLAAAKGAGAKLVLPQATEEEVRRHIEERVANAFAELVTSTRKVPFLRAHPRWPSTQPSDGLERSLRAHALKELASFWQQFEVVRVGYDHVNLGQVMSWYTAATAPFGTGKKKHEFPDAFVASALLEYATRNGCQVAIVSSDADFRRLCENHNELLYFGGLAAYTESLLAGEAAIEPFRACLEADDPSLVENEIWEVFPYSEFWSDRGDNVEVANVEVYEILDFNYHIIAIGETEFILEFSAFVAFDADVAYDEPYTAYREYYGGPSSLSMSARVRDRCEVFGVAKVGVVGGKCALRSFQMEPDRVFVGAIPLRT